MRLTAFAALAAWTCAGVSLAAGDEADVRNVKMNYEYGNFDKVMDLADIALARSDLSDDQRAELSRYAGLAAFNLNKDDEARSHFKSLLRSNPDAELDPFVVPPPAIQFFEKVKLGMSRELETLRMQRRLRAEAQEKQRVEDEERRRRLAELERKVTVKTVEKRNFLVNFVPFGAPQFQQGRNRAGVGLAVTEGAMATASVIAYVTLALLNTGSLRQCTQNTILGDQCQPVGGVTPQDQRQANNWRYVKYTTGAGFYALYALGVVDGIYHHEDQVVTTETTTVPLEPAKPAPSIAPKAYLFPTSGGLGAGLTLHF